MKRRRWSWWIEPCNAIGGFIPLALVAVILSGVGLGLSIASAS